MKFLHCYFLSLLLCTTAFAESKFYLEVGVSYVALQGAQYQDGTGLTVSRSAKIAVGDTPPVQTTKTLLREDTAQAAPFIVAGYTFSDWVGVRVSYHYISNLTAQTHTHVAVLPGYDPPPSFTLRNNFDTYFKDDVHVLSLAPEFKWPVTGKLKVTFSPELNWVASRGTVVDWYYLIQDPAYARIGARRTAQAFTLGASVGAEWSWTKRCALAVSYQYADLKPSWGRQANIFSSALRWRF